MARYRPHLNHGTVVAYLALFVALGGGAYAATQLPANSVGTQQLKNGAVTPSKLEQASLSASSSSFGETLPSGNTLRGTWDVESYVEGTAAAPVVTGSISFGHRLAKRPTAHLIPRGGAPTPECPGTVKAPSAARGHLCLYTGYQWGGTIFLADPRVRSRLGATRFGVGIQAQAPGGALPGDYYGAHGTWAVKAK